jgi:hypothetical protein
VTKEFPNFENVGRKEDTLQYGDCREEWEQEE